MVEVRAGSLMAVRAVGASGSRGRGGAWRWTRVAATLLLIEGCRMARRVGALGREGALLVRSIYVPAGCRGGMPMAQLYGRVLGALTCDPLLGDSWGRGMRDRWLWRRVGLLGSLAGTPIDLCGALKGCLPARLRFACAVCLAFVVSLCGVRLDRRLSLVLASCRVSALCRWFWIEKRDFARSPFPGQPLPDGTQPCH